MGCSHSNSLPIRRSYVNNVYVNNGRGKSCRRLSASARSLGSMEELSLGERLRALRRARGETLAAVAATAEISVSYLNDLEHGRTTPSLGRLHRLSQALGTNIRELLVGVSPYDVPSTIAD